MTSTSSCTPEPPADMAAQMKAHRANLFIKGDSAYAYTVVPAEDPKKSLQFYCELFGFEPNEKEQMDGWCTMKTGTTTVAFHRYVHKLHPHPSHHSHLYPTLSFFVQNIDDFHKKATEKGVKCAEPPVKQPWGGKKADYVDNSGFGFSVVEFPLHD